MSGHSKWSQIKRAKGVADKKRGNVFTKLANTITLITKQSGNGDPDSNPRLRMVIEEARSENMPKENIQRAIDRGLGKLPGQTIEEVVYEGFGPGRVAFLVEGVTDNRMRTTAEIKNLFDRSGGTMGNQGSTAYMFDKVGEIRVKTKGGTAEDEELELIDTGAEDVEGLEEEGVQKYLITTQPTAIAEVSTNITQLGFTVESAEIVFRPNITMDIAEKETADKVLALAEKLEEHDDVQHVFANFDIPEDLLV